MKIENRGKRVNILPIGADLVDVPPGTSIEISDEVWENLKQRASISAKVASGELVESDMSAKAYVPLPDGRKIEVAGLSAIDAEVGTVTAGVVSKPKRGRPAKKAGE